MLNHCKYLIPFTLIFLLLSCSGEKQESIDWRANTEISIQVLDQWYHSDNAGAGLYNGTSWWNTANILTTLILFGSEYDDQYIKYFIEVAHENTDSFLVEAYEDRPAWICQNYINDYYDDEAWWVLTWIYAYNWTDNPVYLYEAEIIFNDLISGWDDVCEGGIYWKKGLGGKVSISNTLTLEAAAELAMIPEAQPPDSLSYREWGELIFSWMMDKQFINKEDVVLNGLNLQNCTSGGNKWTYNQGTFIGGLEAMYRLTNKEHFLKLAHRLAKGGIKYFSNEKNILTEKQCEPDDCNGDNCQFKGVFMRYLSKLNQTDPKLMYQEFILNNASHIWSYARDSVNIIGRRWDLQSPGNACTHSSALDCLVAASITFN
jgi:predicted alpha-1,6-mannanase (GH76 family)